MRFKTPRIQEEYNFLFLQNRRLLFALMYLDYFTQLEFKKDFMITSLLRTAEEQKALYANVTPDKVITNSPHMTWEAADLRSTDFTAEEQKKMLVILNQLTFRNGKSTAFIHQIDGNTTHFHIQVTLP